MELSQFPFASAGDRPVSCRLHDGRTVQGRLFVHDVTSRCLVLIAARSPSEIATDDYVLLNTRHVQTIDFATSGKEATTKPRVAVLDQNVRVAVPVVASAQSPSEVKSRSRSRSPTKRTTVVVQGQQNYSPADRSPKVDSPQLRRANDAANRGQSPAPPSLELRTIHDALKRHLPVKYGTDGHTLLLGDELRLVPPYTSADVRTSSRSRDFSVEERAKRDVAFARAKKLIDSERAVLYPRGTPTAGARPGANQGSAWKRRKEPPTRGG